MGLLKTLNTLVKAIYQLIAAIQQNTKALRLKKPGLVFITVTHEVDKMLFFKLVLPPPSAKDVVKRRLTVQIGSAEPVVTELNIDDKVPEMSGEQNDVVTGDLVDIDDSGNPSDPSTFSDTLTDTISPPVPGQVGFEILREE